MAGRRRKLTVEQEHAVLEWHRLRKSIPNCKKKAAELGVSNSTLNNYIYPKVQRG
jgi:hypothetical protein